MAIRLTEADQKKLDEMVESILFAVRKNELSAANARNALVRTIRAAAIGNEEEFYDWLDPEYLRRWKRELDTKGS